MSIRGTSEKQDRELDYTTATDWSREDEPVSADMFIGASSEAQGWEGLRAGKYGAPEANADYTLTAGLGISNDEFSWLMANPKKPAVSFSTKNGTVDIKMFKPGLTAKAFKEKLLPFNVCTRAKLVEASFDGQYNGQTYLLTVVTSPIGIFPTVTRVSEFSEKGGHIIFKWTKASDSDAKAFLDANVSKLATVLKSQGVTTPVADYLANVKEELGSVAAVDGTQEYDTMTGFYHYSQKVKFSSWLINTAVNHLGTGNIIGAALKVAYDSIGESAMAGAKGQSGPAVKAMDGTTYTPGK